MKQICDHVGVFTTNTETMKDFYTSILGFESGSESVLSASIVDRIFGIAVDCRFIKLHKDGFILEIFEPISGEFRKRAADQVGMNHWGYCVADRDGFVEELRDKHIPVIEIQRGGRSAYFLVDPDGNRIELREGSQQNVQG